MLSRYPPPPQPGTQAPIMSSSRTTGTHRMDAIAAILARLTADDSDGDGSDTDELIAELFDGDEERTGAI